MGGTHESKKLSPEELDAVAGGVGVAIPPVQVAPLSASAIQGILAAAGSAQGGCTRRSTTRRTTRPPPRLRTMAQ